MLKEAIFEGHCNFIEKHNPSYSLISYLANVQMNHFLRVSNITYWLVLGNILYLAFMTFIYKQYQKCANHDGWDGSFNMTTRGRVAQSLDSTIRWINSLLGKIKIKRRVNSEEINL